MLSRLHTEALPKLLGTVMDAADAGTQFTTAQPKSVSVQPPVGQTLGVCSVELEPVREEKFNTVHT